MSLRKAIEEVKEKIEEDRMAGKYKKGQMIVQGQWPNPDTWAKEKSKEHEMSLRQAILDVVQPQKIEEGEDVYDKFGIQITKTRLKGGIGYQINYGERGRYIQVLSKDMNNLMKAMQTAMKAK